jgi:hypothetical protein
MPSACPRRQRRGGSHAVTAPISLARRPTGLQKTLRRAKRWWLLAVAASLGLLPAVIDGWQSAACSPALRRSLRAGWLNHVTTLSCHFFLYLRMLAIWLFGILLGFPCTSGGAVAHVRRGDAREAYSGGYRAGNAPNKHQQCP